MDWTTKICAGANDSVVAVNDGVKTLTVLGATGSIGKSTLDIVDHHTDAFQVVALTANTNVTELARLARRHRAKLAVIGDDSQYSSLKTLLANTDIEVAAGKNAIVDAAGEAADCVMAAIVGAAGLRPTFEAARHGGRIALANKECLVSAGEIFLNEITAASAELIPVDSEHSGIFQALAGADLATVEEIVLTASGGPFRTWGKQRLSKATPEQALKHPNWSMGVKVTIDSATMMNKGLELIEAFHLFPVGADRLSAVIHPQSIVHGFVTFNDGSVIAQMSSPDMRSPIAHALAWPSRIATPTKRLDITSLSGLTFESIDEDRFPALTVARAALKSGGAAPCVLNAANEVAVKAFLDRRIPFLDIAETVAWSLDRAEALGLTRAVSSLEQIIEIDREARTLAASRIGCG